MSVTGVASSNFFNYATEASQSKAQQFRQQFLQLGQDLQSGNLSAAQADFTGLQQLNPQSTSTSSTRSNSAIAQDFSQLSQHLQSGNVTAAQQDYTNIQQDSQGSGAKAHHHHHRGGGSGISQLLQQLGQALQSGNLSSAQQAYSSLEQEFQQFMQGGGTSSGTATQTSSANLSATA